MSASSSHHAGHPAATRARRTPASRLGLGPAAALSLFLALAMTLLSACTSRDPGQAAGERERAGSEARVDGTVPTPAPPSASSPVPQAPLAPAAADMSMAREVAAAMRHAPGVHPHPIRIDPVAGERYPELVAAGTVDVTRAPVSTFSVDVDTAAYANVRRMLHHGIAPPADAVRIEELINYFDYDYPRPHDGHPFSTTVEVGPSPWHAGRHLLHIGLRADLARDVRPARNLVLLVDTSGSMQAPDKLPLLQAALRLMVRQLGPEDRVGIVTYAGHAGVALQPVAGDAKARIDAVIDALAAGGSTHGSAGIATAYRLAAEHFIDGGINRVILATDGDFNVGVADPDGLEDLIERQRASGIGLTVLGFGTGNYNDAIAQRLAQKGNGNAAYIDTLAEARKVLDDELDSTLQTVASDVKVQVEFNPARVAEYRLIGYETRALTREDFDDDRIDAGEIGAGHTVTALYEITLTDSSARALPPLRYGADAAPDRRRARGEELAFLRLRYKPAAAATSRLIERPVLARDIVDDFDATSDRFRFSAAVASYGELLRGGRYSGGLDFDAVARMARSARGTDEHGYRTAFAELAELAGALVAPPTDLARRSDGGP